MIALSLATRIAGLLDARGQPWQPRSGDRFVFPDRDLDQVFVISEMTIEVVDLPTGRLIRFNGTTEWALDSTPAADVVWLPLEHQLRELVGDRFVALARVPEGWAVTLADGSRHVADDPEDAYALALLA
ncbi:MAG: pilus assembly protein CpaE [Nocardioides sp.]